MFLWAKPRIGPSKTCRRVDSINSMRITGLSNQWGDRLFDQFVPDPNSDIRSQVRDEAIQKLLRHLTVIDGPDLWVGTSHSQLNFCARDARDRSELVPVLAYLVSNATGYQISSPIPREFRAWPDAMAVGFASTVEEAATLLLVAIESSDANLNRPSAKWDWFVCPKCDFHSVPYQANCQRCAFQFPPERKAMSIGLYRKPHSPEGAIAPNNAADG